MAVISWGYKGPLYQENWARLASLGGDRYAVGPQANPFGVAAIAGSRRISIGAGTALASGVLCELASMEVIDLPVIDAGTSRFYLAALRRTWGKNPVSTLELIYHSAFANITVPAAPPATFPAAFTSTPGTVDDQPLAWVWYNGSNNTVQVFKVQELSIEKRLALLDSTVTRRLGSARRTNQIIVGSGTTWSDVATFTATASGALVVADWRIQFINGDSGADRVIRLRITVDGAQIGDDVRYDVPLVGGTAGLPGGYNEESRPAAGSHTWRLQATASVENAVYINQAVLTVTEA